MRVYLAIVVVAAVLSTASVPSLQAQALGDIARKEAQRRESLGGGESKVYTNKDLGSGSLAGAGRRAWRRGQGRGVARARHRGKAHAQDRPAAQKRVRTGVTARAVTPAHARAPAPGRPQHKL